MSDATGPGDLRISPHAERMQQRAAAGGDLALVEAILAHLTAQVGKPELVLHEPSPAAPVLGLDLGIDIHIVPPTDEPVLTLFTTGMSEHLMTLPPAVALPRRAELILRLPESWPISEEALADPRTAWPIHWLRTLAQMPQRHGTWLAPLHTIPNGAPPRPLGPGTELCCMLTVPPVCLEEGAEVMASPRGDVMLLSVMPIHEAEMRFKLERGAEALIERLVAAGVDDVIDPQRASVC